MRSGIAVSLSGNDLDMLSAWTGRSERRPGAYQDASTFTTPEVESGGLSRATSVYRLPSSASLGQTGSQSKHTGGSRMPGIEYSEIDEATNGVVLAAGSPGYDEARHIWNSRFDRRPEIVVRCQTPSDVQAAVDFARQRNLLLSVKGGGHAYAANTVGDGGLLVDLSPMKAIKIDTEARTATIGPGATWGDVHQKTSELGLVAVGGTVSTVGVAGLTLGGGSGYLSRLHGMTIDSLLAAEVITADGQTVRASGDHNPDLFWALRGGGGNFGIVTAFEFQLHPLGPQVLFGQIVHRFADADKVLRRYRDFMGEAPDEVQAYAFVLRIPPIPEFPEEYHGEVAMDLVVFHADPGAEAEAAFAPLLDFGDPILAYVAPQPYGEVLAAFDAGLPAGQRYESRSHDLSTLSDEAIDRFLAQVKNLPGVYTMAYVSENGGAMARAESSATAFAGRKAPFSYHLLAGWTDPQEDESMTHWIRSFHEAMRPFAEQTVYVNLLGTDEQQRVRDAYGDNFGRLVESKRKWDPENLFRCNHNIDPSA